MPIHAISTQLSAASSSFDTWIKEHPKLSAITAVAFIVLGITATMATCTVFPTTLSLVTGTVSAISFLFSAKILTTKFSSESIFNYVANRSFLIKIMNETLSCLKQNHYTSANGVQHTLDLTSAARGLTRFDSAGAVFQRPGTERTLISVKDSDCLDVAKDLHTKNLNPLVIDLGNEHHFGGGYLTGARAQEEDCCRRSGLSLAVDTQHGLQTQQHYPLYTAGSQTTGLYVPNVPVFRDKASEGYRFLDQPFSVAFGVIAAYDSPALDNSTGQLRLHPSQAHITRERIRTLLHMAHQKGHQSIVLGALGCGAFKNPPAHIAEMMFDVIDQEFKNVFKEIVISVLDDHNTGHRHNPEGNFKPFAQRAFASGGKVYNAAGAEINSF